MQSDEAILAHIDALLDRELENAATSDDPTLRQTALEFAEQRRKPRRMLVNFSGGIVQRCWAVARSDGTYRLIYLPTAGYFSLCVQSDFGPLDIGVHGPALGCFGSV